MMNKTIKTKKKKKDEGDKSFIVTETGLVETGGTETKRLTVSMSRRGTVAAVAKAETPKVLKPETVEDPEEKDISQEMREKIQRRDPVDDTNVIRSKVHYKDSFLGIFLAMRAIAIMRIKRRKRAANGNKPLSMKSCIAVGKLKSMIGNKKIEVLPNDGGGVNIKLLVGLGNTLLSSPHN